MNLYKKTEAMLYNYRKNKAEIKNILLEIEDIKNTYRGIGAIQYDDMPKAHNIVSNVELEIENKEKRIEYLNLLIEKKENEIRKIDNALEALTDKESEIIKLRYLDKISNKELAQRLDITEQRMSEIKSKIIKTLSSMIFFK